MYCPVCQQGKNFNLVEQHLADFQGEKLKYDIYKCDFCESSFANPLKSAPSEYYDYSVPDWRWEFGQLIDYLDELYNNKSDNKLNILEIGCNEGNFLEKIDDSKYEVLGVDFNHLAIKKAQDKGLNCHVLTIEEIKDKYPNTYFDVICFFHVLEHLENPTQFLKSVQCLLQTNGRIVFSVPNSNRLRLLAGRETHDYPPNHLVRFTRQGLKLLFNRVDLKIHLFKDHPKDINLSRFISFATYSFMQNIGMGGIYDSKIPRLLKSLVKLPFSLLIILVATITYIRNRNLPGSALYVIAEKNK